MTRIYSSVGVLLAAGVLPWTERLIFLKRLKSKAPREFNRRVKELAAERQAIKTERIELTPDLDPLTGNPWSLPWMQKTMTREEFEAEYG